MTDVLVEILNQNWERKAITGSVKSASITDELGQVGSATASIPLDDPIVPSLPNPDENNPFEGRWRIYEDDAVKFAGVVDSTTIRFDENEGSVSFGGKHRGIEVGFYNTGRVDYLGWSAAELMRELLRDNIAKNATIERIDSEDDLYQGYLALSGDPYKSNFWKTTDALPQDIVIDLGEVTDISAIRVMPQWWKDLETTRFHYYKFTVAISDDDSSYSTVYTKSNNNPSSGKGHLYEGNHSCRYIKVTVTASSDGVGRIAQIMVYRDIADIGADTTYVTPFIENDDSGNIARAGDTSRPVVPGAFQGDQVITKSYVTQLNSGSASITQTFRGVSSAVFFTSASSAESHVNIYVDDILRVSNLTIPTNRYWFKGYDTLDDFGVLLSDAEHTLKVERVDGTPRVDYFNGLYRTSWRPIEDDDMSIAYRGSWSAVENARYFNYFAAKGATGDEMHFEFTGDRIRIMGSKTADGGAFTASIDGVSQGSFSTSGTGEHKQVLFDWSGAYGTHSLNVNVTSGFMYLDRLEGNLMHTLYLRSRYEANLKVLIRMSEILDSYLRFNDDGSVDLLGAVGDSSGLIIREGDNEGGTIIQASKEHDYSETGSVCLALVNVNGEMPIKAMVIDREALKEIGWKVIKLENSDAADQFLLNRQALNFLRDHRKPNRAYDVSYEGEEIDVGLTARLYAPSAGLDGSEFRVGKITTDYLGE